MEDKKYIQKLLEITKNYEIEKYKETDFLKLFKSFDGTAKKHTTDSSKVLLIVDPLSEHQECYEFSLSDIGLIEELETITSENGKSIQKIRLWIKRGSIAFKYEPFIV